MQRFDLDGGCYVLSGVPGRGRQPLIDVASGAKHLSQHHLNLKGTKSPIYRFGQSEVVLFVVAGAAKINLAGRKFTLAPESGLAIRPGEAFRAKGDTTMLITVCPEARLERLEDMEKNFDRTFPHRTAAPDAKKRQEMGDRTYQVLVSKKQGLTQVTQFIGEIPKSKAPSHYHLYEEALYVLSGKGFMWTGDNKAPVEAGSIIFLPRKQEHALECTSNAGLRVAGHFYPAGSPAENY